MSRNSCLESLFDSLAAHPYLWTLAACLCCQPFLFGTDPNATSYALSLETLLAIGIAAVFWVYTCQSEDPVQSKLVIFVLAMVLVGCFMARQYTRATNVAFWDFAVPWAVILVALFLLAAFTVPRRRAELAMHQRQINCLTIIALGFLLKVCYVLVTTVYMRQHDVRTFGSGIGHAGYIEYLLFNRSLPNVDVRYLWQFYHPPLHHAISAAWIFFNENVLLVDYRAARESLQMLTLFYSMCIVITSYRILRHFKLRGWALYIPLIIISFHPAFVIFSGSINNDVLSVVFIVLAMLYTLEWYADQTMKGIIKIALCVGLGMMTKLSAAIIAPSVALVFLIALFKRVKSKGEWRPLLSQFACFCVVCIPLGIWFQLRNYILWRVPLGYIQAMDPVANESQYLASIDFLSRATDFSAGQFASPYVQFDRYDIGVSEYNPLVALLKTSVFGEFQIVDANNPMLGSLSDIVAPMLLWTNAAIAVFALAAMIIVCVRKSTVQRTAALFLASFWVVMMLSFYQMSAAFPFTCTMNFRYITPTVIVGAVFIGLCLRSSTARNTTGSKILVSCLASAVFLFAALSEVLYAAIQ